jgi:hypothetical protein
MTIEPTTAPVHAERYLDGGTPPRGAFTSGEAPRGKVKGHRPGRSARVGNCQDGDAGVRLAAGGGGDLAPTRATQTPTASALSW